MSHTAIRSSAPAVAPQLQLILSPIRGWRAFVKRGLDLSLAISLLVLTSPIVLLAAIAVRLQDGGPAFFRQERVGRNGQSFTMLKVRSMVVGAEDQLIDLRPLNERDGPLFKIREDPRVTRIGRVLRDLNVDELPQLINVIKGEMSLVGPRPALPSEVAAFSARHQLRHSVRPGITGLWQVNACDNFDFREYERLDLAYLENWSLTTDVKAVTSSAGTVFKRIGRRVLPRRELAPVVADPAAY